MLVLRLDKPSRCIIDAKYDGDRIALSGAVDRECDTLCQERASFAGVAVPRVSDSQAAALSASGRDGKPLCTGGKGETALRDINTEKIDAQLYRAPEGYEVRARQRLAARALCEHAGFRKRYSRHDRGDVG